MRRPPAAAPTKGGGALRAPPPFVGSYLGGIPTEGGRGNFIHFERSLKMFIVLLFRWGRLGGDVMRFPLKVPSFRRGWGGQFIHF